MLQHLSLIHIYNRSYGMNITTTGYNVGRYEKTSTDYEVQQMTDFKNYLDSKGIRLLYVNEPAKYIDDAYYTEQFLSLIHIYPESDCYYSLYTEVQYREDLADTLGEEYRMAGFKASVPFSWLPSGATYEICLLYQNDGHELFVPTDQTIQI